MSQSQQNLFDELRKYALPGLSTGSREIPEDDPEARVDSSHPPTSYRIEFLRARPIAGAKVVVSAAQWEVAERELMPLQKKIQEKLCAMYRGSLYY